MAGLALLDHARDERLDAVEDAVEVDAEHPAPLLERELPGQRYARDSGVVAEHVNRAELCKRALGERLDGVPARRVCGHADRVVADARGRLLEAGRVDVGHHEAHALGGEAVAERTADAACGAGDDGDPTAQLVHVTQ
jgi:hypothetical protein